MYTNGSKPKYTDVIKLMNSEQKKALDKLVCHNLRFAIMVAKGYTGQGVDIEDLVGAGNNGLIRAACYYEPSKGFKFISYADLRNCSLL